MNITKDKKVSNFIKERYFNNSNDYIADFNSLILKFIDHLFCISNNGIVNNYNHLENDIIKSVFNNNTHNYSKVFEFLHVDQIIELKNNSLYLLIYNEHFLKVKKIVNAPGKRKYTRNILDYQKPIQDVQNKDNNMTYEGSGFKVPEFYSKFLMSYDYSSVDNMTEYELNNYLSINDMTKEYKKFLLLLLSYSNSKGEIESFNLYSIYRASKKEYKNCFGCYETFRKALQLFVDKKIISFKTKYNTNCLVFNNYKTMFGNNQRYIVVPFTLFNNDLDRLSAASMSLLFKLLFLFNNGECGKNKGGGSNRALYLKLFTNPFDLKADKLKYQDKILSLLKKRCNSEVVGCIKELHSFFVISGAKNSHYGVFCVRLKGKYYLTKKATIGRKSTKDYAIKYHKKASFIKDILNEYDYNISLEDLGSLIKGLNNKNVSKNDIKLITTTLAMEINNRGHRGADPLKSITGYAIWLYNEYKYDNPIYLYNIRMAYEKIKLDNYAVDIA